jgi:hypothetical protein
MLSSLHPCVRQVRIFTHLFCLDHAMTRHTLDDDTTLHLLDASHVGEIRVSISPLEITGRASNIKDRVSKPMELSSAAIHEKSKKTGMHTVRSVHLFVFLVGIISQRRKAPVILFRKRTHQVL